MSEKPEIPLSPLQALGERFEQSTRGRISDLLRRYTHRLAPAERLAYEARLRSALPGALIPLRRRLLDRLLRGAVQRHRSTRGWEGLSTLETMPRGPYNDRAVLEEALRRMASADSEWTREYLDLYAGMDKIRIACQTLLPQATKRGFRPEPD